MSLLTYIILFTTIGSIFSLVGGVLLLVYKRVNKITHILSSFAAGALLGAVFFDLLPEGLEQSESTIGSNFLLFILIGILAFYFLERIIHWQHQFHDIMKSHEPIVPMIIIGDSIHNLVDGVAIAAAFFVNIPLGIITAFAVGMHEIPQEIGDFGVLLKKGLRRKTVLLLNFFSALTALIGALLTFYLGSAISELSVILVAVAIGFFLYISLSNLIPEIHHENRKSFGLAESTALIAGILITFYAIQSLHSFLPEHAEDGHFDEAQIYSEQALS